MIKSFLIADSNETDRDALKKALGDHHSLVITEDILQAERCALSKKSFDIILIAVDEATDLDIIDKIHNAQPSAKITALASKDCEDVAIDAVRHGATGYMIKPLSSVEMLAMS